MTEAQLAAFNELAAAAKQEDEAQRAYEEASTALELALTALGGARVERSRAQEKLLQSARSTNESQARH
ncbi:hypothetical protein [Pseudomonas syringae]|uniref:hypothetical protein n=1 Tax=Pseudomonas syringae TaxID=317 RepID=UPI0023F8B969|nr:hypothetical protein [Pseudomonas syringae]MDF7792900.1 hypothetical protein [Pseudomonas syringae]